MLCELCHKNEADGVLKRIGADGEEEELYVCSECRNAGKPKKKRPKPVAEIITADGGEPPEFIRNFLDAAVGLFEGVTKNGMPQEPKCPVCGKTWAQIKDGALTGCPDCWSKFGKEIRSEFLKSAYGKKHLGEIPATTSDGKPSRAFLESELKKAVEKQNFRKAARIRRQLDELEDTEK
jgi:protein-arginine kinase activator protein McsA